MERNTNAERPISISQILLSVLSNVSLMMKHVAIKITKKNCINSFLLITNYISGLRINILKEIIDVYSSNRMKHTNTVY